MEEQKAVVPVGVVRERVIQALTDAFANDLISVAELEERLEKVYRAGTAAEAEALVAGLPMARPSPGTAVSATPQSAMAGYERDREGERFLAMFSSQARRGVWTVPREMKVVALFSDTTLDLTHATLPRDIIEIHVRVVFASLVIVVPPGLRVVNRVGAFAANVESQPALDLAPMTPGAPVVRITGSAAFANVEIVAGPSLPP